MADAQRNRPRFRLGLERHLQGERFQQVFPLRRHWPAILFLLVFDVIFLLPAIGTGREALQLWGAPEDLFSLVAALFTTFWLLGWSMAPLVMTAILLAMLFGREVVRVRPGLVQISLGLPLFSLQAQYEAAAIRNLRLEHPAAKSGTSWRGSHAAFAYGNQSVEFGSALAQRDVDLIRGRIEAAAGVRLGQGEAAPGEGAGLSAAASSWPGAATVAGDKRAVERAPGWQSPSVLALVAANLVVLAGALFYQWDLGRVLVLYWAESAIIGFFNLCKIGVVGRWAALLAGPFFAGHFGGFMAAHFLFLHAFFVQGPSGFSGSTDLQEVAALFAGLWPALLVLFCSHAFSFFYNFLGRKEYEGRTVGQQMHEPYSRIVFMHLVLIFGGALVMVLGDATPVLLAIICVKIAVDVRAHLRQRAAATTPDHTP